MTDPVTAHWLTPARACLLAGLLWAGIYLPALGSLQLKHEEPRRALPAVRMLQTGDWLVPRIGADPYLRKPPLLNWLIAGSFLATGGRSEWAVRLPSVLAMLALALTLAAVGRSWLGAEGALLAAVFFLTNLAAMETGRLAELEALYLSLTGIALILWLTAWRARADPWRLWLAPAPFLALGMLEKGPAHLVFFYGVALAVLAAGRDWRTLRHPAHAAALLVILGPFLLWAVPCAAAAGSLGHGGGGPGGYGGGAWGFWWREVSSRAELPPPGHFPLAAWLLRVPQGFINFLPWSVLLPLLWLPGVRAGIAAAGEREAALFRGARRGMAATFLLMSLLPGSSARYVYPLLAAPCALLARALTLPGATDTPLYPHWLPDAWRRVNWVLFGVIAFAGAAMPISAPRGSRLGLIVEGVGICLFAGLLIESNFGGAKRVLPHALKSALGMALITAVYALAAVPRLACPRPTQLREVAAAVRGALPPGQTLGVLDDGYHAFWYYLEPNVVYLHLWADQPAAGSVRAFLVPAASADGFTGDAARQGTALRPALKVSDGDRHAFVLLTASPPSEP